ncbi:MAG: pentapeptide repeat-containing protein [Gammaproteobacteria bacterium]|nr:pentapeptide repeat-containing protein [Gammaproteobacteria bacterium]
MASTHNNKGRWYVKKADKILGPFPNRTISSSLILGRITLDTEVSQDQEHWVAVKEYNALVPDVVREAHTPEGAKALMLARVREDERAARAKAATEPGDERRVDEDQIIKLHRQLRDDILKKYHNKPIINKQTISIALLVFVIIMITAVVLQPPSQQIGADCSATAIAGVNWSSCNKQGVKLANMDLTASQFKSTRFEAASFNGSKLDNAELSYANLSQADLQQASLQGAALVGANLRQANLQGANLQGANLSYAELEGANLQSTRLENVRFDHAIWVNGAQCLPGSLGGCLLGE